MRRVVGKLILDPLQETRAILNAMQVQPSWAMARRIDSTIDALKLAGIWDDLDVLYLLAAETSQAALLNWKKPGTLTASAISNVTFTANQGFLCGNGPGYIDTGFTPSLSGIKWTLNDASLWCWSRVSTASTANENTVGAGNAAMCVRSSTNTARGRMNDGTTSATAAVSTDASGLFCIQRTTSTHKRWFRNGTQLGADQAITSVAVSTSSIATCGAAAGTNLVHQIALVAGGASLTGKEATFYNIILAHMTAIGAA
jgi:hypothetical protein